MAVRGTAESHSPGATGLRFCARGCGPKPVRFFNSHTSRCSLLGRAVEENGCALNRRESLSSRNWLEVLCLRGADQNLSAFFLSARSEEHTSELQSPDHLVCRLLLEK